MVNSMSANKKLSFCVGIPTCYGGTSLIATVKSIRQSERGRDCRIRIISDRNPIAPATMDLLYRLGVEVTWNEKEGSVQKKLKQIIDSCIEDVLITTQDDIIFDASTIVEIMKSFESDPEVTMVTSRIAPLPPENFFEAAMGVGVRVPFRVARQWNHGMNHISASGRCMSFKTSFAKHFNILPNMVNGDMYLYLENKRLNGVHAHNDNSIAYIRCPQHFKDHIGPSSRYQISHGELQKYVDWDISDEYKLPIFLIIKEMSREFLFHPILSVSYVAIFIATRLKRQPMKDAGNWLWKTDLSTKNIKA